MASKLLIKFEKSRVTSVRCLHQINLAKGSGGRSSYSGLSATVFGATGQIGRAVTNHLAATGTQLVLPFRGEEKRILPLRVMSDLGQMMFRPHSIKDDEAYTKELIQYSNVVLNFIGCNRPFQHYSLEEVNLEWPMRLAQMVKDKGDGTKLIHVTNLGCHQQRARNLSKVLQLQFEAESEMKSIYPDTIIVRSAPVYGKKDSFVNLLTNEKWKDLAVLGALPCLHGAGHDTIVQPVFISDLAKACAMIANEDASRGQIFEFVGKDRFRLSDVVEFLYDLPLLSKPSVCLHDALGPIHRRDSSLTQKAAQTFMDMYFRRQYRPSLLPHFFDLIWKNFGRTTWMSEERFKMLHVTDYLSGEHPGFDDLSIELTDFEQKIWELFYSRVANPAEYHHFNNEKIPRIHDDFRVKTSPMMPAVE